MRSEISPEALALNHADGVTEPCSEQDSRAALCLALPPENEGAVPECIELIPAPAANGRIEGQDGRWWSNPDADAVIAATRLPLPLDVNHATELKAPQGEWAPAVGWIEALQARGGAIWGKAAWNPARHYAVAQREYRSISPVFLYAKDGGHRILRLMNAALTNRPNLNLTALKQDEGRPGERSLLESHLDSYAYEDLSKAERPLFDRHFNAEGEQHRTFCQLFGPEKNPE